MELIETIAFKRNLLLDIRIVLKKVLVLVYFSEKLSLLKLQDNIDLKIRKIN